MDHEFHYYITGLLAYAAGFTADEARTIAYACQFTDDNDMPFFIRDGAKEYSNIITQTFDITLPKWMLLRIYPVFHFLPGVSGGDVKRKDGRTHPLCCSPDSALARKVLRKAFRALAATRLYRIGIASHAYADSWAHQGYVGGFTRFNSVSRIFPLPVGHLNKGMLPDWFGGRWLDERLVHPAIDNQTRFLSAAKRLYENYTSFLRKQGRMFNMTWDNVEAAILYVARNAAPGADGMKSRIASYKDLMPWLPEYDRWTWFNEAVTPGARSRIRQGLYTVFFGTFTRFNWKARPEETHWYKFQEAAKEHLQLVLPMLEPLFHRV